MAARQVKANLRENECIPSDCVRLVRVLRGGRRQHYAPPPHCSTVQLGSVVAGAASGGGAGVKEDEHIPPGIPGVSRVCGTLSPVHYY
jgi:hypothetical protein